MITKNDLKVIVHCIDSLSKSGGIHPDAMMAVGATYLNVKRAIEMLDEGDILIQFSPDKKKEVAELPQESKTETSEEKPQETRKGNTKQGR